MEDTHLDGATSASSDPPFFDAPDELPPPEPEEDVDSPTTSRLESVGDATGEGSGPARPPQTPPTSLRRRRPSSRSTAPRKVATADSKGSSCESPADSEIVNPRERRNQIALTLKDQASGGADPQGSEISSAQNGAVEGRDREVSVLQAERDDRGAGEPAALDGSPPWSGILVSIAGLVIRVIGFQISLLVCSITFPVWLLHCFFLLVTDPFRTLKRGGEYASQKLVWFCGVVRDKVGPFVFERLSSQQGVGKLVLRLAVGCFWSFYVCFVLLGCLAMALLVGRLLLGCVIEEPLWMTEELSFDYTKSSPVALVPIISCQGANCGLDCSEKLGVGKSGGRHRIPPKHKLQLTLSLTLPESDYNQKLGVFQVRAEFLSANGKVTTSSSRPCMLLFKSTPIRFLETFFRTGPLLAGYSSESQIISLKMRGFTEGIEPTACVRVSIEQRAEFRPGAGIPEIYAASIKLESELPLFKRILWNWRRTVFIWISIGLFIFEVLVILVCCSPLIIPRARPRDITSNRT